MVLIDIWVVVSILSHLIITVWCHARLMSPPSRSSMWRLGFPTEKNYDDDGLYCGGFYVQWQQNEGKCGLCGDPYNTKQPRENEAGGKYGSGIISQTYTSGQTIEALVHVTANHKGYFEFKVCPNNNPSKEATQGCLDKYILKQANGNGSRVYISDKGHGNVTVRLQLPKGLTCSQCVFQWTYVAGNNWGLCEDGTAGLGCGPQETFRACADIEIKALHDFETRKPNKNNFKPTTSFDFDHNSINNKVFETPLFPKNPTILYKPLPHAHADENHKTHTNTFQYTNQFFKNNQNNLAWKFLSQFGDDLMNHETFPYFTSNHFLTGNLFDTTKKYLDNHNDYYAMHPSKSNLENSEVSGDSVLSKPMFYLLSKISEKGDSNIEPVSYFTSFHNNELSQNSEDTTGGFDLGGRKYKDFWFLS